MRYGAIARANLDGTHVSESFVRIAGTTDGLAINSSYIYWANYGTGTIGRATLGGRHVNQSFVAAGAKVSGGESAPMGIAPGP